MALYYVFDENLPGRLDRAVRRHNARGLYVIDVVRVGGPADLRRGSTDPAVLVWGERENRVLVSVDKRTIPGHRTAHLATTRLTMGTGVHGGNRQSDQSRMGFEKLVGLFQHAYDRGLRFFDLADLYGTHVYFREALRKIPREEITILTKLWWRYDGEEG